MQQQPQPQQAAVEPAPLLPILDPPDVGGANPNQLPHGSRDTVIRITGAKFYPPSADLSAGTIGLVNGGARATTYVDYSNLDITVTEADLAAKGTLKITAQNISVSVTWAQLTVT